MSGPKAEMQFRYWDLRRRGMTQSEIARKFEISRQAVNKSIKLHEREIMYRLLESAQTTGALVEWFDAKRGILIGVTPQLGNIPCLILIDFKDRVRTFFDQTGNNNIEARTATMNNLKNAIGSSLGIDVSDEVSFRNLLKRVYQG